MSNKHKHYNMIVAMAANTSLVKFHHNGIEWHKTTCDFTFHEQHRYFLCLPQHEEACLHWLNGGGEVEERYRGGWSLIEITDNDYPNEWVTDHGFMQESFLFRIKPRKEKRWIAYCASRNQSTPHPTKTKEQAADYTAMHYQYHTSEWQFIEIEVEVSN